MGLLNWQKGENLVQVNASALVQETMAASSASEPPLTMIPLIHVMGEIVLEDGTNEAQGDYWMMTNTDSWIPFETSLHSTFLVVDDCFQLSMEDLTLIWDGTNHLRNTKGKLTIHADTLTINFVLQDDSWDISASTTFVQDAPQTVA